MVDTPYGLLQQFNRKLWMVAIVDCILGVILFLVSLNLIAYYLQDFQIESPCKWYLVPSIFWVVISVCFIMEPVISISILLQATREQTQEIGILFTWIKVSSKTIILTLPGIFFFFIFYLISPFLAVAGFVICATKLILHFRKLNIASSYLERNSLLVAYNPPGERSGSVTPDIPSYGAFGPPLYEDAIKNKNGTA